MYADRMSSAMEEAIGETNRRREIQTAYNEAHGITPTTIVKAVQDILEREREETKEIQKQDLSILKGGYNLFNANDRKKYIKALEKEMLEAAKNLEFERAAVIRDEIVAIREGQFSS
jgi:excinuclease ABC subunit B